MPVRRRGLVRPASPGYRSRVDPNALRSRAGMMPPIAAHVHFFLILDESVHYSELENRDLKHMVYEPHRVFHFAAIRSYALKTNDLATVTIIF